METRVTEADGVHQLTTVVPTMPVAFDQYLVTGDEPLLFHTGMRGLFPLVSEAVSTVVPAESLRWVSVGHVEAELPHAAVAQSQMGCLAALAWGSSATVGRHLRVG